MFLWSEHINREQNIVLDDNCKCAEIHKVADTSQKLTVYGRPSCKIFSGSVNYFCRKIFLLIS